MTLRLRPHVWSLRSQRGMAVVEAALRGAVDRPDFRVTHFSAQGNHVHLVVEAGGTDALTSGMKAISIRLAKGMNRLMGTRGPVLADRYHAHLLRAAEGRPASPRHPGSIRFRCAPRPRRPAGLLARAPGRPALGYNPPVRSLALLAVLLPALALAGTITAGPTPEEQARAAKAQAAKAKQPKKPPAKKAPAKKPPPKKKPPAAKAPAPAPRPTPAAEDAPPAAPVRPSSAKDNFRKANPCPSTGRSSGSCPGYEVEHMNPPACGGADSPGNMQWVQASAARKKGAPECKTR